MKNLLLILFSSIGLLANDALPEGFVYLSDVDSSIILEMRYVTSHNFVGEKIEGYLCGECILTEAAADSLAKVQQTLLQFGLSLKIYDCYRPQKAVDHFVAWAEDVSDTAMKREFYPQVDKSKLFAEGYIAERSGHSRGSTVDLTIVPLPVPEQEAYSEGMELKECTLEAHQRFGDNSIDMGTGFDCFSPKSHTVNAELKPIEKVNRLLLKTLMEKYGFKHYPYEWWHFTLADEPFHDTYFDFNIICK